MPIPDDHRSNKIDYKQKYINLKRKLKLLIYENESYSEELKKSERQLLQVSRDKSYLLDRLLQYEKIESSTSDTEDTLSSDSEAEPRKLELKKKKTSDSNVTNEPQNSSATSSRKKKANTSAARSRSSSTGKAAKTQSTATQASGITTSSVTSITTSTMTTPLTKNELSLSLNQPLAAGSQSSKASVSSTSSVNSTIDGHMTSEELERHLESRRQPSALLMPEKTPLTVPVELFSNESSNGLPDDDNHSLKLMP